MMTWRTSLRRSPLPGTEGGRPSPRRVDFPPYRWISDRSRADAALPLLGPGLYLLESRLGEHQRLVAEHIGHGHLARLEDGDARDVPKALQRADLLGIEHQKNRPSSPPLLERLGGLLRRRLREGRAVQDGDAPARGVDRERGAKRASPGLAVDLDGVVPRLWAEGDAAASAVRHAERAGACAAGALLAPGLGGGHRDLPASERGGSATAAGGHVGARRLVHERLVELLAEHVGRKVRLGLLAQHRGLGRSRGHQSDLTSTVPFFGPGTAPLRSKRLRSASTSTTSSRRCVTRLPPMRPGIFTPLKTRAGSALAPIEPGARTLCEPWETGPRAKLWRRTVP